MTMHRISFLWLALFFITPTFAETVDISNDILGSLDFNTGLTNAPVTTTDPLAASTTVSGATAPAGPTPNDILAACMRQYPPDICGKAYFNTYLKNVPPSMVALTASGQDPMMECIKSFGPNPVCELAFSGKGQEEPKQDNFMMMMMMLMQMMNGGDDSGGEFSTQSLGLGDPSSSLMGGIGY